MATRFFLFRHRGFFIQSGVGVVVGTAGVCILYQLMRRPTSWLVSGQKHRRRRRVKDNILLGRLTTGCTGEAIARHRVKHPCDPADMQVPMPIEAGAKPRDEGHSAEVSCCLVCLGSTQSMKQRRCLGIDSTPWRTDRWGTRTLSSAPPSRPCAGWRTSFCDD